jgi:hypothetical protein
MSKPNKKRTVIIVCIIIALYAASKFRITETGDTHYLVFYLGQDSSAAWTLYPVTIHTDNGDIHLKAFTDLYYSGGLFGYSYSIDIDDGESGTHNVSFMGTALSPNIDAIYVGNNKEVTGFSSYYNPQEIVIDGIPLFLIEYETSYIVFGHLEADAMITIFDFKEIILQDGTVVILASPYPECFLKQNPEQWELYFDGVFLVTNPAWDEAKYLDKIVFEPKWGNLISYEEVE